MEAMRARSSGRPCFAFAAVLLALALVLVDVRAGVIDELDQRPQPRQPYDLAYAGDDQDQGMMIPEPEDITDPDDYYDELTDPDESQWRPAMSKRAMSWSDLFSRKGPLVDRRERRGLKVHRSDTGKLHLCLEHGSSCSRSSKFIDCCPTQVCQCNLFGSNCRCTTRGFMYLFGK